jgi:hypothetical protein
MEVSYEWAWRGGSHLWTMRRGSNLQARLLRRSKLELCRLELSAPGNTASTLRATQPLLV